MSKTMKVMVGMLLVAGSVAIAAGWRATEDFTVVDGSGSYTNLGDAVVIKNAVVKVGATADITFKAVRGSTTNLLLIITGVTDTAILADAFYKLDKSETFLIESSVTNAHTASLELWSE